MAKDILKGNAWGPKNELFVCDCDSIEHQFIMQTYDWTEDGKVTEREWPPELNIYVFLSDWPYFWKRLGRGIKYIFGYKCRYGHFDVASVKREDINRIRKVLDNFENKLIAYHSEMDANLVAKNKSSKIEV